MTYALGVEIIFLTRDGDESILLQNWIESKLGNQYTRALMFLDFLMEYGSLVQAYGINEVSKAISTY